MNFQQILQQKDSIEQGLKQQLNHVSIASSALVRLRSSTQAVFTSCSRKDELTSSQTEKAQFIAGIREKFMQIQNDLNELDKLSKYLVNDNRGKIVEDTDVLLSDGKTTLPIMKSDTILHKYLALIEEQYNMSFWGDLLVINERGEKGLFSEAFKCYNWHNRLRENCTCAYHYASTIGYHKPRWTIPEEGSGMMSKKNYRYSESNSLLSDNSALHNIKIVIRNEGVLKPYEYLKQAYLDQLPKLLMIYPINNQSTVYNNNRILEVSVNHSMKAFIVLRGFTLESIIVRGLDEQQTNEDGSIDLTTQSKYQVFRKITDNATAAIQHYYIYTYNKEQLSSFDHNIKTVIAWLRSYKNLFVEKCKTCQKFFNDEGMVPTWRDFKSFHCYHDGCRPLMTN